MLLLFWSKFMELSKLSASDFKLLLSFFLMNNTPIIFLIVVVNFNLI